MVKLKFPIVKNVKTKILSDDLISVEPYIPEGYENWPVYNPEYPNVHTLAELKEYINDFLKDKKESEWISCLKADKVVLIPIIEKEQSIEVISINSTWNVNDFSCLKHGGTICNLDPQKWNISLITKVLTEIKEQFII